jgi:hypothetical protein
MSDCGRSTFFPRRNAFSGLLGAGMNVSIELCVDCEGVSVLGRALASTLDEPLLLVLEGVCRVVLDRTFGSR